MKKTALIAVAILIATAGCAKAKEVPTLKVGTEAAWPPMEYMQDKEIVGFDIDLMNAIAKHGGFKVEFSNAPWDTIFASLEFGEYDAVVSSVTIKEERKEKIDFSEPYLNAGQVLVLRKDADEKELKDLKGKTVGAQFSTTGAEEIDKIDGVKKQTFDNINLAVEALADGKIDAVITDTPNAANIVRHEAKFKGKFKLSGDAFTVENYGIAVKKGNAKVLSLINGGLKKVIESGELKKIEDKWLR